jgi:mutual gliding-motility protein MglA
MVLFNYATRELTAKVVYYGPGLCGKTTNLEFIHKALPEKSRGKMLSLATQTDRTLFFDFLPLDLGNIKGMKTRVQLYTVPGQVFYDATRKLVLKGADGVVFVADSQKEMMQSNLDSWENLKQNLSENNLDINTIPLVIQYNKRDLPNVLPVKDLNKKLNVLKAPYFEAIALTGMGVQETFKGIAKVVMSSLAKKYGKPDEVAVALKEEAAATGEKASVAPAPLKVLPSDETLDLTALEEEVQELPQVEELEITEESSLSLEPVELPSEPAVPEPKPAAASSPEKTTQPKQAPAVEELPFVYEEPHRRQASSVRAGNATSAVRIQDSGETELVPDETVHISRASVSGSAAAQEIPIEISVRREGQDVKLNISLHLRIRIED